VLWCGVLCCARPCWAVLSGVLRSTFASLVREVPRALLARQLLSGAAAPGAWWSGQQAFTASAAAGSIVGWLLGLGDRHMDNLLLDRCGTEPDHCYSLLMPLPAASLPDLLLAGIHGVALCLMTAANAKGKHQRQAGLGQNPLGGALVLML